MRAAAILLLLQLFLFAGDRSTVSFYMENDVAFKTDFYYTGGMKISYLSQDLRTRAAASPWQRALWDQLPFYSEEGYRNNIGLALGVQVYTPQDTQSTELIEQDRPYAGWTYLAYSFISRNTAVQHTLETRIGMVGPDSRAREIQDAIHEATGNRLQQGWEHQLNNELGLNLHYERRRRLVSTRLGDRWQFELFGNMGGAVGNINTYANAGTVMRIGRHMGDDFGPSLIAFSSASPVPLSHDVTHWGYGFFLGVDGRVVAHNIFLDGNTFSESHSVPKKRVVGGVGYGFGLHYDAWRFVFANALSSREFEGQPKPQWYSSFMLSRAF